MKFDEKVSRKAVEGLRRRPKLIPIVKWGNRIITYANILLYPLLLVYLVFTKSPLLFRAIVVPLDAYIILTVARWLINRPRPYEILGFEPVIPKKTKGKSFPSRHVFSAMVIGMTFLLWSPFWWIGVISIIISFALAYIRVITGVHYLSDVCAGLLVGALAGIIGYVII